MITKRALKHYIDRAVSSAAQRAYLNSHVPSGLRHADDEVKEKKAKQKVRKKKEELKKSSEKLLKTIEKSNVGKTPETKGRVEALKKKIKALIEKLKNPDVSVGILALLATGIYTAWYFIQEIEESRELARRQREIRAYLASARNTINRQEANRIANQRNANRQEVNRVTNQVNELRRAVNSIIAEPDREDYEETQRIEREQRERAEARRREREAEFQRAREPEFRQSQPAAQRNFEEGRYSSIAEEMRQSNGRSNQLRQLQRAGSKTISPNAVRGHNLNQVSSKERDPNRNKSAGVIRNGRLVGGRAKRPNLSKVPTNPRYGGLDMDSARNLLAYVRRRCRL